MEKGITLWDIPRITEMVNHAVEAVVNGDVDPIRLHINISRLEAAIKLIKENTDVRDITLRELSKYGKSYTFGDCLLEEAESGVKYDYSVCHDSKLTDMYAMLEALKADIKERETMLKHIPSSGVADPDTGEVLYPPIKSSKTIIRTTFKK